MICLRQCFQTSFEQSSGVSRVVYAQASILVCNEDPVPEGSSLVFGDGCDGRVTFLIQPAEGNQAFFQLVEHGLDFGLQTAEVEVFDIGVAALAGGYVRLKEVVGVFTSVAGDTGVFHHRVVRAGAAFHITGASNAEQHSALSTVVRTPVGAGDFDFAVNRICNPAPRLVAVGAQVALAAVVSHAFKCIKRNRVSGFQRPVCTCVGGVYLVAGTAVLAGRVWITLFDLIGS